ncbi:Cfr10I/Bse634I family restriction endonuclease [Mycobacteroides abscessus]|uniref:Cfr10I/Bse634I family restriction endonuclease n=1 Tax=Mycobacteroides abscessus TaxID=36809 RepID=UPI0021021A21|nr:Cfr10I/Bse634I family restriction endonuclease [Mycobacteroides abscessus]
MQQNILTYTFDQWVPGFSNSRVYNTTDIRDLVQRGIENADLEGKIRFQQDYRVSDNARAKVLGDLYETLTTAMLWNAAALWNIYMATGKWTGSPGYQKPTLSPLPKRQVAVLNLPRGYDWVRLLNLKSRQAIELVRNPLSAQGLTIPTSTPDIAVVVLPDDAARSDSRWRTKLNNLQLAQQSTLANGYAELAGRIEPGELILAIAAKRSLRSDRLYQPLYEANIMQLLLEHFLGAPRVDFEVHTLSVEGTAAQDIYAAATIYAVATKSPQVHRAVRELYLPTTPIPFVSRFLDFLNQRLASVK